MSERMTPRDREVVLARVRTGSVSRTAMALDISGYAVKRHLMRAYRVLGVESITAAAVALIRRDPEFRVQVFDRCQWTRPSQGTA